MIVDSLEVQLGSSSEQANQSIDKMIKKLDVVIGSLMGITKETKNMGASFKVPNLNNFEKGINSFAKIETKTIEKVGDRMRELSKEFQTINGLNFGDNAKQFVELANGISRLGSKTAIQAIDNIPKIAPAINAMMAELQKAPIVSQNLIDMTNAIGRFARTGSSGGKAVRSLTSEFYTLPSASGVALKSLKNVQKGFQNLTRQIAPFINIFALFSLSKKSIEISSDLTEIQNVVDVTFGNMTHKVEQFAETSIEQFGMSELTLKKVASTFQAMGSAMNINSGNIASANEYLNKQTDGYVELGNSMADVSLNLTKLTADMASFYNVEQDVVAEDLQSIFTGMVRPMRAYGIDLTEVNLQQWAMTQGLNSNIDAMTQAEKTMLRYQYVLAHTGASQNDFQRTSMSYANTLRILKQNFQQLGSIIGGTFINMLKPLMQALNNAMSGIIAFAETVSNALGKIFGWKYEVGNGGVTSDLESGADYADDLSDSMGSASDNAKKLKSYLLGIDELNVLEPQQDTSGGGGSGAGVGAGGGGASGGQWVKTDGLFADYESEIDTLYKLGDYISQTLSRMMESIDWESIYQKSRNFGTGLAEFLNGLISPRLFGNIGKTIANSLNTALEFLNSFGETFEWKEFGESIAWGINDFFINFNWELLATTLNTWVNGLQDAINGFLSTLQWDSIVEGIGKFIGSLEGDTILTLLGIANIKKFGTAIGSLIGQNIGGFGTSKMSGGVPSNIMEKNSAPTGTAEGVSALTIAFEGLSFAIEACVIAAEGLIILDTVKDPLIDMLGSMTDNQQKAEELKETYKGLAGSVQLLMDTSTPITSFFNGLPTVMGGATQANLAMAEALDKIAEGTIYSDKQLLKMQETWSLTTEDVETLRQAMLDANPEVFEMTKSFDSLTDSSYETLEDVATGLILIKDGAVLAEDAVSEFSKPMWDMNDSALAFFETISNGETSLEKFNEDMGLVGENISAGLTEGVANADVETPSQGIFDRFVTAIKNIFGIHSPAESMKPLGEYIFLGIVEGFQNSFNSFTELISAFWTDYVSPWFTSEKWSELYSTIQTELENTWNGVVDWWTTSGIYRWYNDSVKPWFSKENWNFSGIKDGLVTAWENAIAGVKAVWNKFANWFNSKMKIELPKIEIGGETIFKGKSIDFIKLPTFQTGGFPEDGLFMANHTELVGRFSNGRTAVANNEMITQGIEEAVYRGFSMAYSENTREASLLEELIVAVREGKSIVIDGRELVEAYDSRKTRNGYAF